MNATADSSGIAGWYGKLPVLGDFASRRLDPAFIEAWDDWLAEGLGSWRERCPESWLEAYLAGPSWRFVLLDGVLPTEAATGPVAGVLVPSVDRVGRYFPFTLAWALSALPTGMDSVAALLQQLHMFDDLVLDVLNDDWSVERLEQELERIALEATPRNPAATALSPELVSGEDNSPPGIATRLTMLGRTALLERWSGCVLWLCDPSRTAPHFQVTRGLPRGSEFEQLLSGQLSSSGPFPPGN